MKTSLIFLFLIASFFVRSLRWLGVLQQKEYRMDRLLLYLISSEGIKELFRIIPKKNDFTRTGLKRPKLTARSILMSILFVVVTFVYFSYANIIGKEFLLNWYPYPLWYNLILFILVALIFLIFI